MNNLQLENELEIVINIAENIVSSEDIDLVLGENKSLFSIVSIAILTGELEKINKKIEWDRYSFALINLINKMIGKGAIDASVFYGLSGFGYAVLANYKNGTRYSRLLSQLNNKISSLVMQQIKETAPSMELLECISGLTGTGRYLLFFKDDKRIQQTIESIISYIIEFTKDIEYDGHTLPGWYISVEQLREREKDTFNKGYFNYGLSHGVAGCMAFLSICIINGIEVEGQRKAIKKILDFIYKQKVVRNGEVQFDGIVKLENYLEGKRNDNSVGNRPSWCYGAGGICRSIFLAGKALDEEYYVNDSMDMIISTCSEKLLNGHVFDSPTFCHGYSGYMNIVNLFYKDTKDSRLKTIIEKVRKIVLSFNDKQNVLGFSNYEKSYKNNVDYEIEKEDKIDIVEGAISVLLPLIELNKSNKAEWNAIFLLD